MTHGVLIVVTDELGTKTIIDTQAMGTEHPLGDHVLSAIHRLQHGFGRDVDKCIKKINDTVERAAQLHNTIQRLIDPAIERLTDDTLTDAFMADPTTGVKPVPAEAEFEAVIDVTARPWMKTYSAAQVAAAQVAYERTKFDGSQPHSHDGEGWCRDEKLGRVRKLDYPGEMFWHADDHDHADDPLDDTQPYDRHPDDETTG